MYDDAVHVLCTASLFFEQMWSTAETVASHWKCTIFITSWIDIADCHCRYGMLCSCIHVLNPHAHMYILNPWCACTRRAVAVILCISVCLLL